MNSKDEVHRYTGEDGDDNAGVNREIVCTPVFIFSFSNT